MGLSTALGAALSGLRMTQRGLDLTAVNVANSQTPGYTRKSLVSTATVLGGQASGVEVSAVRRELDVYLQRQLRVETAGGAFANARADSLGRLQTIFGTPGGKLSLDTLTNDFSAALDKLAASPDDQNARADVLAKAQILAQQLNSNSRDVQALREDADRRMADGVAAANEAIDMIGSLTDEIVKTRLRGEPTGDLEDLRDAAIDTLSGLMDVRIEHNADGSVHIKTSGGVALFDENGGAKLSFDAAGSIDAGDSYPDSLSGITLTRPSGQTFDLLEEGQLRSGSLRALADQRDKTLPQAQAQLDELAANLAMALGTKVEAGTPIAGGVSLKADGARSGDRMTVTYTSGGVTRTVTIVNVADASKLPLGDDATADPNDVVVGIDFNSPTAAADLQAALGGKGVAINVAETADGFAFTSGDPALTITGGQSRLASTALSGAGLALPFFTDGPDIYSGSLDGDGQRAGFAARIAVNAELLADPSKLTKYAADTPAGDPARATFLREALGAKRDFSADAGLGGTSAPFSGSIADFAQGIISMQARASASATRVAEGQSLVVASLSDRLSDSSGVDVDQEMSNLIQLQTAYGANARVITTVKEMMDMLMRI